MLLREVQGRRFTDICEIAHKALAAYRRSTGLWRVVDEVFMDDFLPNLGVKVIAERADRPLFLSADMEGLTRVESARKTFLILREHYFDALFEPNRYTNRARCTLYHEFAHWVLHRGEILELQDRIIKDPSSLTVLARAREDRPVPDGWTSPEWQAYAFAGAFLMPPSEFDPDQVSALELSLEFDVSLTFAEYHLGRCQRLL